MNIRLIIAPVIFFTFFGCVSFFQSNQSELEVNTIQKIALDNSKTANEFLEKYDYAKALEYYTMALNNNILIDNSEGMIKNYEDLGKVNMLKRDILKALESYNKALKIIDEEKIFESERGFILNGIGEVYYLEKDFKNAKEYFRNAKKVSKSIEHQAIIMLNLAKIDRLEGDFETALQRLLISARLFDILKRRHKLTNEKNLSLTLYSIGQTYSKKNNFSKAMDYIKKALEIDKTIENASGIADDYYALGILEEKFSKKYSEALKYYERSKEIYKILNSVQQFVELSEKTAGIYLMQKNYKEYLENKRNSFILSGIEEKKVISKEVLEVLSKADLKDKFSENEYKQLFDFFSKEIK